MKSITVTMTHGWISLLVWLVSITGVAGQKLTVMTYNIHHGTSQRGGTNLIQVGRLIRTTGADLVALQEVDSATASSLGKNQAAQLSYLTGLKAVFGKEANAEAGGYGLAILSKYPIIAQQLIQLPNPDLTDPRVLLCAYVELPSKKTVRFCTTRLDDRSEVGRGVQAATISALLEPSIQPVIWAGDLNAHPDHKAVEPLLGRWYDAGRKSDAITFPDMGSRTDYILTQPGGPLKPLSYRVIEDNNTSYHYPVVATYQLK
ncbi:hypothetical protein DYU11_11275 [Fibrisoma montanum]|uniref:Endonuclease/exonuclease/phosphatase domain-containing protein n=2 Tax=Fibrisoma montanum TaxID=2305895 RepID=A0A418MB09_9BACT|nr:hypothetical protein DYU11_11275 [Fibrisoma montanum]